jgi:hypothetical protein
MPKFEIVFNIEGSIVIEVPSSPRARTDVYEKFCNLSKNDLLTHLRTSKVEITDYIPLFEEKIA